MLSVQSLKENVNKKINKLKEACKTYTDLTAERLPQVDPIPLN